MHHLTTGCIKDPANLLVGLRAADIGVREFQNMLTVSMLLILLSHLCKKGQGAPLGQFLHLAFTLGFYTLIFFLDTVDL